MWRGLKKPEPSRIDSHAATRLRSAISGGTVIGSNPAGIEGSRRIRPARRTRLDRSMRRCAWWPPGGGEREGGLRRSHRVVEIVAAWPATARGLNAYGVDHLLQRSQQSPLRFVPASAATVLPVAGHATARAFVHAAGRGLSLGASRHHTRALIVTVVTGFGVVNAATRSGCAASSPFLSNESRSAVTICA